MFGTHAPLTGAVKAVHDGDLSWTKNIVLKRIQPNLPQLGPDDIERAWVSGGEGFFPFGGGSQKPSIRNTTG